MGHGGLRKGGGRPKGAAAKKTRAIADKAASEGLTPLEYMLEVLRDETNDREMRMDAAKSAAPYIHPRLSSVNADININAAEQWLKDTLAAGGTGVSAAGGPVPAVRGEMPENQDEEWGDNAAAS